MNNKLTHKSSTVLFIFIVLAIVITGGLFVHKPQADLDSQPNGGIVVFGDCRTGHDIFSRIIADMKLLKPQAIFGTGDYVDDGSIQSEWDQFFTLSAELFKSVPFYPAIGNHENTAKPYFDSFILPNNERWYAVDVAGIHFIILDSGADNKPGSEQNSWMIKELTQASQSDHFIAIIFHHPPFCSTGSYLADNWGVPDNVLPQFEQYGVDLVFNGHDHTYERSLYHDINYIVTGGGGAPLKYPKKENIYKVVRVDKYNFCYIIPAPDKLIIKAFDPDGQLLDELVLNK